MSALTPSFQKWLRVRSHSEIIASYDDSNFAHCHIRQLEYRDFMCLNKSKNVNDMWLNNFLIDFCTGCLVKDRSKYTVISCNISGIILRTNAKSVEEAEIMREDELNSIPFLKGTLIMPINKQNDWCLAIADLDKQTFIYIDPIGEKECTIEHYMFYFITTISKYNASKTIQIPTNAWKTVKLQHPCQKDIYNCGVFVLMFVEKLVKNESFLFDAQPEHYREYLKKLLYDHASQLS